MKRTILITLLFLGLSSGSFLYGPAGAPAAWEIFGISVDSLVIGAGTVGDQDITVYADTGGTPFEWFKWNEGADRTDIADGVFIDDGVSITTNLINGGGTLTLATTAGNLILDSDNFGAVQRGSIYLGGDSKDSIVVRATDSLVVQGFTQFANDVPFTLGAGTVGDQDVVVYADTGGTAFEWFRWDEGLDGTIFPGYLFTSSVYAGCYVNSSNYMRLHYENGLQSRGRGITIDPETVSAGRLNLGDNEKDSIVVQAADTLVVQGFTQFANDVPFTLGAGTVGDQDIVVYADTGGTPFEWFKWDEGDNRAEFAGLLFAETGLQASGSVRSINSYVQAGTGVILPDGGYIRPTISDPAVMFIGGDVKDSIVIRVNDSLVVRGPTYLNGRVASDEEFTWHTGACCFGGGSTFIPAEAASHPTTLNGLIYAGSPGLPYNIAGGVVVLDQITIYYTTDANGDDFDFDFVRSDHDGSITVDATEDNIGNGSTGAQSETILAADVTLSDFNYYVVIDVNNTDANTDVKIYDIKFEGHLE